MNVLFLACGMPGDDRNGLTLRVHQLAANIDRQTSAIFLLSINPVGSIAPHQRRHYVEIEEIAIPAEPLGRAHSAWSKIALSRWSVSHWFPGIRDVVLAHVERWHIDSIVEFSGLTLASLGGSLGKVPLLCDLVDTPTIASRRQLARSRRLSLEWWQALYDHARFRAYQRRDLGVADAITVVSEIDAEEQRRSNPTVPVSVIPNGVDAQFFEFRRDAIKRFDIVFEGNMSFPPNVDAALHLVNIVLPLIRKKKPDATLALVGKDPVPEVSALASQAVTVTGTVEDVRPFLWQARVFACPMRLGAGIKNKILQAWSAGVPVVCSSASTPGLGGVDGEHFVVRDDAVEFAATICDLIDDPPRRRSLADSGRAHVEKAFSWELQSERLIRALESLRAIERMHSQRAP